MSSEKYSIFGNNKINGSRIFNRGRYDLRVICNGQLKIKMIDNAVCIKPLKSIRFDRTCDETQIKVQNRMLSRISNTKIYFMAPLSHPGTSSKNISSFKRIIKLCDREFHNIDTFHLQDDIK
jgi:hypothetical protein